MGDCPSLLSTWLLVSVTTVWKEKIVVYGIFHAVVDLRMLTQDNYETPPPHLA